MMSVFRRWHERFRQTVETIETESHSPEPDQGIDWQVVGVLCLAAVILSFLEYYGTSGRYTTLVRPLGWFVDDPENLIKSVFRSGDYARLARLAYWSGCTTLGYLVLPAIYIKVVMKGRLRDFGFSLKGVFQHAWIYVSLYILVLPAVYLVSFSETFQRTYPFYEFAHRSPVDFFAWQAIYALQFLSLEFFYRGFLIHGLKHRFGVYAIMVSTLPYCMIHFGKPLPETLGAIVAGMALGWLALYTRSIWSGVTIHVSVAITMDVLSLLAQGKL